MRRVWGVVRREPVRFYLYGVLLGGEGVALTYGLLSKEQAAAWLGLGAAMLAVPAIERARSRVTPVDPADGH